MIEFGEEIEVRGTITVRNAVQIKLDEIVGDKVVFLLKTGAGPAKRTVVQLGDAHVIDMTVDVS